MWDNYFKNRYIPQTACLLIDTLYSDLSASDISWKLLPLLRRSRITDFVVIITDDKGNEINYSTVTESGEFYISGLAPGKYILKLDDRYIDAYGLEKIDGLSEHEIYIPFDYENLTEIMDKNLEYKTLSL